MCAQDAEKKLRELFGGKALYIPYTDPGYILFKSVEDSIRRHRAEHGEEPAVIWLQNHGIFVAANTIAEIKALYSNIIDRLDSAIAHLKPAVAEAPAIGAEQIVPALRMMVSGAA